MSSACKLQLAERTLGAMGVVVFVQIGDQHIGALARICNRHRAADAAVAAGDQRRVPLELVRSPIGFLAMVTDVMVWQSICAQSLGVANDGEPIVAP